MWNTRVVRQAAGERRAATPRQKGDTMGNQLRELIHPVAGRLAVSVVLIVIALVNWPGARAAGYGPLAAMPAIHTAGGPLNEEGLHFDELGDPEMGAYDYAASVGTNAWLRGMAEGDQIYPTRFKYWKENSCKVHARLQLLINGQWYDYWQYDIHIIHVKSSLSSVYATQSVSYSGDWYHVVVGSVESPTLCPPATGSHVHLSGRMYGSGWFSLYPHANDTCWADSTQCDTVMSMSKRLHSTCLSWNGWTNNRSGTIASYTCESWSVMTRDDVTPAFKKY